MKYPYRHRDLNWLSFNERVLQEAADPSTPLYERLKFLAIFSSNLDEFFAVRVSRLRQIKKIDKQIRKKLALKPNKQVKEIVKTVKQQQEQFGNIFYKQLIPQLANQNIYLVSEKTLDFNQQGHATEYFISKILPLLTIKIIDPNRNSDVFLKNNHLYFLVTFKDESSLGLVNIPSQELGRFFCFPPSSEKHYVTFLDDIIRRHIDQIFENKDITGCYEIKLSRDAELYIEDEFEGDLADKIKESLSRRDDGQPTRLLYDTNIPKDVLKQIRNYFGLGKIDLVPGGKYHNFSDFFGFPDPTKSIDLHYPEVAQVQHSAFDNQTNYFKQIGQKDQLVHFPYMSFDYVQHFINQSAIDPLVTDIKISLYRVAKESELTTSLLKALENGKKVTVFVEAKARFDEENNLKWGQIFEDKGAEVHYSYPNIKVHSKILLIKRNENKEQKLYAYIGTGNFNAKTSKIYCDHGIFTAHPKITKDLAEVFEVLSAKCILPKPKHLLVAPFTIRSAFDQLIDREIELAKSGKTAKIMAKLNSLEDQKIIDKLYEASSAGVTIKLLVRGFCCLIPGIPKLSENIEIISIIDRYLEHGRIYVFNNDNDPKVFIGSADWMTRNLDKRIEVLTPIYDPDCRKELLDILNLQIKDNIKARYQDTTASNTYRIKMSSEPVIRSQSEIRTYLNEVHTKMNQYQLPKQYLKT